MTELRVSIGAFYVAAGDGTGVTTGTGVIVIGADTLAGGAAGGAGGAAGGIAAIAMGAGARARAIATRVTAGTVTGKNLVPAHKRAAVAQRAESFPGSPTILSDSTP